MKMKKLILLDVIALLLVIIGALNWGLVGFFHYNLVSTLFGPGLERVIYVIVGLAGIYALWWEGSKILHKEL
jgi:uncharacterized protein